MTRKLIYTQDSVGEYTIADETEKWVTVVGQVETESDARLFCAAPELLEALQRCETILSVIPLEVCDVEDLLHARAVINKATGEER